MYTAAILWEIFDNVILIAFKCTVRQAVETHSSSNSLIQFQFPYTHSSQFACTGKACWTHLSYNTHTTTDKPDIMDSTYFRNVFGLFSKNIKKKKKTNLIFDCRENGVVVHNVLGFCRQLHGPNEREHRHSFDGQTPLDRTVERHRRNEILGRPAGN